MFSFLSFLSPQVWLLVGAVAASSTATWRVTSWMYQSEISGMRADKAKAAQKATESNRRVEQLAGELSQALSEQLAEKQEEQKVVTKFVRKEVIRYVQNPNIIRCELSPDFVRAHDSAASGRVPPDSETSSGVDAGTNDAELLEVVTENYGICRENRQRQIALQQWAKSIQKLN